MTKIVRSNSIARVSPASENTGDNIDASSGHPAHVSHFGNLKAGPTIAVLNGNFPGSTLNDDVWTSDIENSASLTVADGMAELDCGTNAAGLIIIQSRRKGRFIAGQVSVFQSGVRVGTPIANNTRIWGMMNFAGTEGLYFKTDGTTFQVVAKKGGVETTVDSSSFSGDTSFTPGDSNNTYRIEYSAGRAIFYRAKAGKKIVLHEMVNTAEPLVNDLALGLYYENTNSGNTTSSSMYVRGASVSVWGNVQKYNEADSAIVTDIGTEAAQGTIPGYKTGTKFGRNPDIDTGTTPEDVWNAGGVYTGFNATANENLEVLSSDADDTGVQVSSGTATGGSATTLVDSGATFVTDSVAVGDLLINDSRSAHGVITSVDSETQVTVFSMNDFKTDQFSNQPGDSYRIANANDTGCGVVLLSNLLDNVFVPQDPKYVILNGTTGVTVTGTFARCSRIKAVLSGSSGVNEGTITVRQATTTANVMAQMPTTGQSTIGCGTVPAGSTYLMKRYRVSITRTNGSAGSATVVFFVRPFGQSWNGIRVFEVQNGPGTNFESFGGDVLHAGTDFKFQVTDVSDNNTVCEAAIEFLETT